MDRFYIGSYDDSSGLQTDMRPFLIPDNAFAKLDNAYIFRGRVRKRPGSTYLDNNVNQLTSRLRIKCGTFIAPTSPVPSNSGEIGQMFSIVNVIFTVNTTGNPMNLLVANGSATTATFDTTTGEFVFAGVKDADGVAVPDASSIYFYPAFPVMGLLTYNQTNNNFEKTIAFDTKFAYQYSSGWDRIKTETTAGAATWSGDDAQFFWGTMWTGTNADEKILFVTNFNLNEANFMRQYNGTAWDDFRPQITATPDYLFSARILVVFKNRLLAFNTWEGPNVIGALNYQNRVRWAAIGNPTSSSPNAWRQDIAGQGSARDCATTEAIISVEFIKDRLIVYFESSTWELLYTNNQIYPFVWQQINTELGVESTFSIVPFDKVVLGVGNVGIHACNAINTERIDTKIPDVVFGIHNEDSGVERVYGIRDYWTEMVWWTFPANDADAENKFPNRVLMYNYKNGTWAFFRDSITVFGYFQPTTGITWDDDGITWDSSVTWDSASSEAEFKKIVAGNQQGYTFILDRDEVTNIPALQITDIAVTGGSGSPFVVQITSINHNLRLNDFVYIEGIVSDNNLEDLNNQTYKVLYDFLDPNKFTFETSTIITGTYAGGGTMRRVSNIEIQTKQFNFYANKGSNAVVSSVDFLVDRTNIGKIQVEYLPSSSENVIENTNYSIDGSSPLLGTNTLETFPYTDYYPYELDADRLWRTVTMMAEGNVIQFQFKFNDSQMLDIQETDTGVFTSPVFMDFQLHAMIINAMPSSSRMQ